MLLIQTGFVTPPVGICLYVTQGVALGSSLADVSRGAAGFLVMICIGLVLLTIWPDIVLWLPKQM